MPFPLTVSLTPAFIFENDSLLRAQLRCLSEQRAKEFEVLLVDPHFSIRSSYIPELAEHYHLNIVHVPYQPNQHVAKRLDCAVFNAAYCYSESPRIVRYSCWRFVRPDFTRLCLESTTNVDFRFHSCAPKDDAHTHPETGHDTSIWNIGSDEVKWGAVPSRAASPGATWGGDSDHDAPESSFPLNCYGNYMVFRDQWLNLNGTDEVFTNTAHYEDMDFTLRAHNAGMRCERRCHQMYRLHHNYGNFSGRANQPTDFPLKENCAECENACLVLEPNRFDLKRRNAAGEIEYFPEHRVWFCKTCSLSGPIYHASCGEHTEWIKSSRRTKATIIPKHKLGRNLRAVTSDMDGQSVASKVEIFKDSWTNPRYYQA